MLKRAVRTYRGVALYPQDLHHPVCKPEVFAPLISAINLDTAFAIFWRLHGPFSWLMVVARHVDRICLGRNFELKNKIAAKSGFYATNRIC